MLVALDRLAGLVEDRHQATGRVVDRRVHRLGRPVAVHVDLLADDLVEPHGEGQRSLNFRLGL
ncbi:MAG: hypothetical protein K8F56_07355 [Rhodocyclaceae bacterium]|nr:hypothetical protein [Rhodocyclaceae bacterium]